MDTCNFSLLSYIVAYFPQVAKFDPPLHPKLGTDTERENEPLSKQVTDDDRATSQGSSQTLQQTDIVHVVGDIIHVSSKRPGPTNAIHFLPSAYPNLHRRHARAALRKCVQRRS